MFLLLWFVVIGFLITGVLMLVTMISTKTTVSNCRECPALKFQGVKIPPICRVTKKEIANIDVMNCKEEKK